MSNKVEDQAFVTLVTNDRYAYGALVMGQSLRDVGTTRQLAILVTPTVSQPMRRQLSLLYDYIHEVDPLDSQDDAHLALLTRPDLGVTFTKIYCWRLTQYTKCVFMDADTLVLQNVDDLFAREELSAAPDVGWPDCFNSGVFVFVPSNETYRGLLQCAVTQGSFDGGDQGLLNTFFSDWATADINKHLPFLYNMTSAISYSYLPAFVRFGNEVRIVHFIGRTKPWMYQYNTHSSVLSLPPNVDVAHDLNYVQMWWNVFINKVKPWVEQEQDKTAQTPKCGAEEHSNQHHHHGGYVDEDRREPPVVDTRPAVVVIEGQNDSLPSMPIAEGSSGIDLANTFGDLTLTEDSGQLRGPSSPRATQHAWERGQIDYRGQDSFDNIMSHIQEGINNGGGADSNRTAETANQGVGVAAATAGVDSNRILGAGAKDSNVTKS